MANLEGTVKMGWCAQKLLVACKYFLLTWVVGNTNNELTMKLKKKELWEVKKVEITHRNLFKKAGWGERDGMDGDGVELKWRMENGRGFWTCLQISEAESKSEQEI